jgi:hypothetical protein
LLTRNVYSLADLSLSPVFRRKWPSIYVCVAYRREALQDSRPQNEVFNPEWLEFQFGLPVGWTSPQEHRAATALLAPVEQHLETVLTPDLQRSPSKEFCTCPSCGETLLNLADSCGVCGWLLGDIENSPSKDSPSKKRRRGEGNGYIHWRSITKGGKEYPQAYYHWKENGNKRSKYIPKKLLGVIQEAEKEKRPVIEILGLLGVTVSPSNLLGDTEVNPNNLEVLGDIEISPSNLENSPSKVDFSPSKTRRHKGEGSGSIHWRTITKGGKDYPQAYYHYEFWNQGGAKGGRSHRLTKSTKYIPKRLLAQVQQMEEDKAPVREILGVLGVVV